MKVNYIYIHTSMAVEILTVNPSIGILIHIHILIILLSIGPIIILVL